MLNEQCLLQPERGCFEARNVDNENAKGAPTVFEANESIELN